MSNHRSDELYLYKSGRGIEPHICVKCGIIIKDGDIILQKSSGGRIKHLGAKTYGHLIHKQCFVDSKGEQIYE